MTLCCSVRHLYQLMISPKYPSAMTAEGFPIYSVDNNAIRWVCDANSPCSSPPPSSWLTPEFFFLIEFSNR